MSNIESKKVLILSCGTGGGHNSAARAVREYLLEKNVEADFVEYLEYDYVVETHLFPAQALTAIKKEHEIHFMAVATDYVSIPFWEETDPDYFIIPNKDLIKDFEEKGIAKEKLLPLGIPVGKAFGTKYNKDDAKIELKLNLNKKYILLLTGSMGFGNVTKMLDFLKT